MNREFFVQNARNSDFAEILALHAQNHRSNLDLEARSDGFLTIEISESDLQTLADARTLWIARGAQNQIAGYVLAAHWDFYERWPMFRVQTDRFPLDLPFSDAQLTRENSFQYGPVCVAAPFRGRGVLPTLFEAVKNGLRADFAFGATFIATKNARSLAAHRKLGFEIVDAWQSGGNDYQTLAFPTQSR